MTDFPPYDLDRLTQTARARLIEQGEDPSRLGVYRMVARVRAEELRQVRGRERAQTPAIAGGMTEEQTL